MRTVVFVAILCLLATVATGAEAGSFKGDLKSLKVGDKAMVNATIINKLPVDDTVNLKLSGDAIDNGLIGNIKYPPACTPTGNAYECTASVPAEGQTSVNLTVEAMATGQDTLVGIVNSSTTDLTERDTLEVRVGARFQKNVFSAPGITEPFLAVIAGLAGLVIFYRREQ